MNKMSSRIMDGSEVSCVREAVVDVVMSRLMNNIAHLESLTERLHGKLNPVMSNEYPCAATESCKEQEYPPLFNDIRSVCYRMENVISSIENALSRTEL